ncbi:MAG: hypothetical protein ACERKJ_01780 [Candidatus Dadabacteria bacterium]
MRLILILCMTIVLGMGVVLAQANPVINEADAPKFLYTMSAKSGTYENGRLTLNDVPLVVYFSDRPARISGQLSIQVFEQGWRQGPDSFKADPPNATLSILSEDGNKNIVVELSEPDVKVKEGKISFKVRVLDGDLPKTFEHSTLFIDSFGPCPGC